jgi:hypothetical protein
VAPKESKDEKVLEVIPLDELDDGELRADEELVDDEEEDVE